MQPPGGVHHITARGVRRQPIFVDDHDRSVYLELLSEAGQRFGGRIHAYCLMTNHVHLVIEDVAGELSRLVRHVNGLFAQRSNYRHGGSGHFFERRFSSSLIETDSYLVVAVEYVHRNPLEAGMVDAADEHGWSSYPAYLGICRTPEFLETSMVMSYYGNDRNLLRTSTELGRKADGKQAALASRNPAPVLGSESFVKAATAKVEPSSETSASLLKCVDAQRFSMEQIAAAAARVLQVDVEHLHVSVRGHRNDARSLAIYVAHRLCGLPLRSIASFFELSSVGSVTMCSRRFADRVHEEPTLLRAVEDVGSSLQPRASASEDLAPSQVGQPGTPSSRGTPVLFKKPETKR